MKPSDNPSAADNQQETSIPQFSMGSVDQTSQAFLNGLKSVSEIINANGSLSSEDPRYLAVIKMLECIWDEEKARLNAVISGLDSTSKDEITAQLQLFHRYRLKKLGI